MNILYCFISHNKVVVEDYNHINEMMNKYNNLNYCIYYGGEKHIENKNVIHLNCNDGYCDLPEKINSLCKYLSNLKQLDFIVKLDRTVTISKPIPDSDFLGKNYFGLVGPFYTGKFHINKCGKDHLWNQKVFEGEVIEYCLGGYGYSISKKSIDIISKDNSYKDYVYEDYYCADVLRKNGIKPEYVNLRNNFYDPQHPPY